MKKKDRRGRNQGGEEKVRLEGDMCLHSYFSVHSVLHVKLYCLSNWTQTGKILLFETNKITVTTYLIPLFVIALVESSSESTMRCKSNLQ